MIVIGVILVVTVVSLGLWLAAHHLAQGYRPGTVVRMRASDPTLGEAHWHNWVVIDGVWHRFTDGQLSEAKKRALLNSDDAPDARARALRSRLREGPASRK